MKRREFLKLIGAGLIVPSVLGFNEKKIDRKFINCEGTNPYLEPEYNHFDPNKEWGNLIPIKPYGRNRSEVISIIKPILTKDMKNIMPPNYRHKVVFLLGEYDYRRVYIGAWLYRPHCDYSNFAKWGYII